MLTCHTWIQGSPAQIKIPEACTSTTAVVTGATQIQFFQVSVTLFCDEAAI